MAGCCPHRADPRGESRIGHPPGRARPRRPRGAGGATGAGGGSGHDPAATRSRREDLMATRDLARRLAAAERLAGAERFFVVEVPAEASEQQRAAILAERGIAPRPRDTIVFLQRWS